MRRLSLLLLLAVAFAGCDSNDPVATSCPNDGDVAVDDQTVGTGQAAAPGRRVTVAYTGTLDDGTIFDSSANATFALVSPAPNRPGVIAGFIFGIGGTDGVAPMRIGGTRTITIPPNLGYGAAGRGAIPGCAVLEFDVTLIDLG